MTSYTSCIYWNKIDMDWGREEHTLKGRKNVTLVLSPAMIAGFEGYLRQEERSASTIGKYIRDLRAFSSFTGGLPVTKEQMLGWKERLAASYKAASVNSMLAAVNSFLAWAGWPQLRVKPLRRQREVFSEPEKELTRNEYIRLVQAAAAEGNERLSLVIQTICATGIRVSELQFITVEAICSGRAEVDCKGKRRPVFLPEDLRRALRRYVKRQNRNGGPVFVTKNGKPLDRSNIWRDMKSLCARAGVEPGKVFPHNLRHLFARTYYSLERDLSRLADILGHSNINTTRIYTVESGVIHARQLERLRLVVT